jgi:acyl-CoA thioester hydrolase
MPRTPPDTRDRYAHFVVVATRVGDNDLYNHVNNAAYYAFFDTAVTEYMLREGGLDLRSSPVEYVVAENGCRYFRPLSYPDAAHCGLRLAHLGTRSARIEIGVFREAEAEACAQGYSVVVCCDALGHRPVPLPAAMREALRRLQRGAVP